MTRMCDTCLSRIDGRQTGAADALTPRTTIIPIPYMQRTREYYLALGYRVPYRWAHYNDAPFTPLITPLAEARLALITTAAPYRPDARRPGAGRAVQRQHQVHRGLLCPD